MRIGACHDVDADGFVTATDEDIVDQHQANEGQALYDYHYDLNGDGVVSEVDVTLVTAQASTSCPDTANIDYDGAGLRIRLKVRPVEEDPVNTTTYVWDAAASLPVIVQETTNGATTSYVYALDMLSATDNSNVTTYFLQDGLGSTTGLTDDDGDVTDTYAYDVFGAMKSQTGTSGNAWRFTGELQDTAVGRAPYYLRARYYDLALGRFFSGDPWPANPMNPQTLNRYPYVLNNPALLVDPYGLFGPSWFEKAIDVAKCALDPLASAVDETLDRIPGGGLAKCVLTYGPTLCAEKQAAERLVGEKSARLGREILTAAWRQVKRSSSWFNNTCPGEITRALAGSTVFTVGLAGAATPGFEWLSPLMPAGYQIGFGGPPGQPPLEHCY